MIMLIINGIWIVYMVYYVCSYGVSLWREDKNKLASVGAFFIAIISGIGTFGYYLFRG
ncbi:MAG: hypothetical protein H7Y41_04885 [Hyphomonadaceae bacterium]|nr:hypothetical protein [Clostridia bacterium]